MDNETPVRLTPREMQESIDEIMRSAPPPAGRPRIILDPVDVCTIHYMKPEDELLTPEVRYRSEYGDGMVLLTNEHWNAVVAEVERLRGVQAEASENAPCASNTHNPVKLAQIIDGAE